MAKAMDYNNFGSAIDTRIGFISGAICAIIKLLDIYLLADPYMVVVVKVLFTAVAGGFGGVAGKHLYTMFRDWCVKKWREYYKNKKKQP